MQATTAASSSTTFKPNTHRRRRRDETVLSRRVGVGGVYWALVVTSDCEHDNYVANRRFLGGLWPFYSFLLDHTCTLSADRLEAGQVIALQLARGHETGGEESPNGIQGKSPVRVWRRSLRSQIQCNECTICI